MPRATRWSPPARTQRALQSASWLASPRGRVLVLELRPMLVTGDVLEAVEVDAFARDARPSGPDVRQRLLDRSRHAEDHRRGIGRHGEAHGLQFGWRQHGSLPAALQHVGDLRDTLERAAD